MRPDARRGPGCCSTAGPVSLCTRINHRHTHGPRPPGHGIGCVRASGCPLRAAERTRDTRRWIAGRTAVKRTRRGQCRCASSPVETESRRGPPSLANRPRERTRRGSPASARRLRSACRSRSSGARFEWRRRRIRRLPHWRIGNGTAVHGKWPNWPRSPRTATGRRASPQQASRPIPPYPGLRIMYIM